MKKAKKSKQRRRQTSTSGQPATPRPVSTSTIISTVTSDATLAEHDRPDAETTGERRLSITSNISVFNTENVLKTNEEMSRDRKLSLTNNDLCLSDAESVLKTGADTARDKRLSLTNDLSVSESESVFKNGAETYRRQAKRYKRISFGADLPPLSVALSRQVFLYVPATDLVRHCSLVCKSWLAMCRDSHLWQEKCEQAKRFVPDVVGLPAKTFMMAYFKNPYTRNLLHNTHAMDGLDFWIQPRGCQAVNVEEEPDGAYPIRDYIPAEEINGRIQNWVTSYRYTYLSQSVVLPDEGVSKIVLDELRPAIKVSVWCAAHCDSGARFYLLIRLIDKRKKEIERFEKKLDLSYEVLRKVWHKVEYTFFDYKPGLRKVVFKMGGTDTQGWRGLYGAKFTLPCVRFVFSPEEYDEC